MEARLKLQLMSLLPRPVAEDSSWGLFEFDEIGAEFSSIIYKSSLKTSLPGLPKIGSGAIASH